MSQERRKNALPSLSLLYGLLPESTTGRLKTSGTATTRLKPSGPKDNWTIRSSPNDISPNVFMIYILANVSMIL